MDRVSNPRVRCLYIMTNMYQLNQKLLEGVPPLHPLKWNYRGPTGGLERLPASLSSG